MPTTPRPTTIARAAEVLAEASACTPHTPCAMCRGMGGLCYAYHLGGVEGALEALLEELGHNVDHDDGSKP